MGRELPGEEGSREFSTGFSSGFFEWFFYGNVAFTSWNTSFLDSTMKSSPCTHTHRRHHPDFQLCETFGSTATASQPAFMKTSLRSNSCHKRAAFRVP